MRVIDLSGVIVGACLELALLSCNARYLPPAICSTRGVGNFGGRRVLL